MEELTKLVRKVLKAMQQEPPLIVVFVGDLKDIVPTCTSISKSLPNHFVTTIDVQYIEHSTAYLKSHDTRWQKCTAVYKDNCYKHVTPEQFLNTHYQWLYKQVNRLYAKQPDIEGMFSIEDAFQECCMSLDRILSKFDNQCNLRTYVANRLRFYFDRAVKQQLELRRNEILAQLGRLQG